MYDEDGEFYEVIDYDEYIEQSSYDSSCDGLSYDEFYNTTE